MITQEKLKELLYYDPNTGLFTRVKKTQGARLGDIAGSVNAKGYVRIGILGFRYRAHRLAFLYMNGSIPSCEIDHINHKRDDNRWGNLRRVTRTENSRNASMSRKNTSGYSGVCWDKGAIKWQAYIRASGKRVHLGYFTDKTDAIKARQAANIEHGYHENHGV